MLDAAVTTKLFKRGAVVRTHASDVKNAWFSEGDARDMSARVAIASYEKRSSTEKIPATSKISNFGSVYLITHIKREDRRFLLLLIDALAEILLVILGAAEDPVGIYMHFSMNTVK